MQPSRFQGSWRKALADVVGRLHKTREGNAGSAELATIAAAAAAWAADSAAPPQLLLPLKEAEHETAADDDDSEDDDSDDSERKATTATQQRGPLTFSSLKGADLAAAEALRRASLRGKQPAFCLFLVEITQTQRASRASTRRRRLCAAHAPAPPARAGHGAELQRRGRGGL